MGPAKQGGRVNRLRLNGQVIGFFVVAIKTPIRTRVTTTPTREVATLTHKICATGLYDRTVVVVAVVGDLSQSRDSNFLGRPPRLSYFCLAQNG